MQELPEYRAQLDQQARQKDKVSNLSKIFAIHDVVETSYHFVSQQIVLHLCDDSGGNCFRQQKMFLYWSHFFLGGRSSHPNLKDGGALQIALRRFQVDYYPYHLAKGDRKHWPCYREGVTPHTQWYEQALSAFRSKLLDLVERNKAQHVPLSRSTKVICFVIERRFFWKCFIGGSSAARGFKKGAEPSKSESAEKFCDESICEVDDYLCDIEDGGFYFV